MKLLDATMGTQPKITSLEIMLDKPDSNVRCLLFGIKSIIFLKVEPLYKILFKVSQMFSFEDTKTKQLRIFI